MRIIVAHPGRQHSYRLASALKKSGDLLFYVTTVYDKKGAWLLSLAKRLLRADNRKRAMRQHNPDLDDSEVKTFCTFGGVVEKLLVRFPRFRPLYDFVSEYNSKRFGIRVAKLAIRNKADMVVCYDSNAWSCFSYLRRKAPQIKRVMDVSIAARHYMREIYNEEISKRGASELIANNQYMWHEKSMRPMLEEILDTDYFLAASNFVKDSLIFCGAKAEQIKIVPYGANVASDIERGPVANNERIEFLFVGQVIYRKGIPYAIEAIKQIAPSKAHLTFTGTYNISDSFIRDNINDEHLSFTGQVTQDKLQKIYEKSHVFVLPSFAEGMAQVGIEAMACGLPIICTYNSGVANLVVDGENGFIIPPGDADALCQKMQWFVDNRDMIPEMGRNGRATASTYTWENYAHNVVATLHNL